MNLVEEQITIEGEVLALTSLRAMYWEKEQALVASDLHIGKSAHFRRHGIPISAKVQQKDLQRLEFLVSHYQAKKLIVVGDLFHAEVNTDMADFKHWRNQNLDLEIILIKGNHDRLKDDIYEAYQISCCQKELLMPPFQFIHEPKASRQFSISGHLHPGVRIKQKGRPQIKLPCYEVSATQLILPAFSEFTGLAMSRAKKGKQFYAFTETSFFEF
ncbi:ligase-associated DNA damage response endonuclease PdeM [Subsaximicrobium wynnwilliamsii]|jgi:DNA ligase-associated metallophosphoesterase|uniref:Ligase-associated DNA damage response endonuclease PdeM n=1 Tax=Subsaximicrobium wynnwilliamsii TaxID=291179 RepID=A0A5C6ZER8_9FLAO|nr:ligase-associated DNA damage response endonuclease PdeM [Subsaximicrobium wynnwilliamsii]TXD81959.1 ligase-associated DNA damage response endonuclease PdeM [Subsaximicrobium wynnwilliamsii]TXD87657.1 ligase-associated DNA damage response endonuclease PdeM [Subsaximicrobium wynnwilliamsii]TXE01404.1 ligase-associated DNA damage response endonuclease PdeM [Subsaximicrobium wynnwilliamsii]